MTHTEMVLAVDKL